MRTKANSHNTKTHLSTSTTRRAVLVSAAAVTASPAIAAASALSAGDCNPELLELEKRLEAVFLTELEDHICTARLYHESNRIGGDPWERGISEEEFDARLKAREDFFGVHKTASSEPELSDKEIDAQTDAETEKRVALIRAITAQEATNLRELRVHALAALFLAIPDTYSHEGGFEFGEGYYDEECRGALLRSVITLTGLEPFYNEWNAKLIEVATGDAGEVS